MDISQLIRQRLDDLGLDQKNLAAAAEVSESYISQLLKKKKSPPAPGRTQLYEKMADFLKLPAGELSHLAEVQRKQELKKRIADPPQPLLAEFRELILRKCPSERRAALRRIFEKDTFGELERLIGQKLLEVSQGIARRELRRDEGVRLMESMGAMNSYQRRAAILDFLDTNVFYVTVENRVGLLDAIIHSWDIDLKNFSLEVVPHPRLGPDALRRFEFSEVKADDRFEIEAGFAQFLHDKSLSGDASAEEIEFLQSLQFRGRRPTALYFYRELQSLRDPLHFPPTESGKVN